MLRASLLLTVLFVLPSIHLHAQVLLEEPFDDVPVLWEQGWVKKNRSYPLGSETWMQAGPLGAPAYDGDSIAFIGNGYLAGGVSDHTWTNLSDWLFTPPLDLENGDVVSFRALSWSCFSQPDRLEVRMNTSLGTNVGDASTSVGEYEIVLLHINEDQLPLGMPSVSMGDDWAVYSATITGLGGPTTCRIAVRYFVVNGGPAGPNSSFIGVDDLRVERNVIGIEEGQVRRLRCSPNPTDGIVRIEDPLLAGNGTIRLSTQDGRCRWSVHANTTGTIDLSSEASGVYILEQIDPSTGTVMRTRVVKQ